MGLNCGIVGLPNVGKSTIFNALTQTQAAQAANYPFCTIEPNTGMVGVPDKRLTVLQDIVKTQRVIPTQLELVDIAGLVKGASKGEGKGNEFLNAIKGVDAILHVVRCFEDPNIIHVEGSIDPVRDIETIDLELILKDEDVVKTKFDKLAKRRQVDKDAALLAPVLEKVLAAFKLAKPARLAGLTAEEAALIKDLQLITMKPMMFVCNVLDSDFTTGGNAFSKAVVAHATTIGSRAILICGKIEEELVQLSPAERAEMMQGLGINESGIELLVRAGYELLGLQTYFTAGEKEVRAWQIEKGWKAPRAAAVIHTDFEKGFIRAEVAGYDEFVKNRGEKGCRDAGKLRPEGKDYVVQDGDVVHFLFAK